MMYVTNINFPLNFYLAREFFPNSYSSQPKRGMYIKNVQIHHLESMHPHYLKDTMAKIRDLLEIC